MFPNYKTSSQATDQSSSPCWSLQYFPLSTVLFSAVSITHGQPQSKDIKWKIPEIKELQVLNCTLFWVAWWNLVPSCQGCEASICPMYPRCMCYPPVTHLVAVLVIRLTFMESQCLCSVTLILLNNNPKAQEQWCWQFGRAKEKPESVSFKWEGKYSTRRYFERYHFTWLLLQYNCSILLLSLLISFCA